MKYNGKRKYEKYTPRKNNLTPFSPMTYADVPVYTNTEITTIKDRTRIYNNVGPATKHFTNMFFNNRKISCFVKNFCLNEFGDCLPLNAKVDILVSWKYYMQYSTPCWY